MAASGLEVRAEPGATGAAKYRLAPGTEVTIVGRRGHWVHVVTSSGIDGWADGLSLAGVAATTVTPPDTDPAAPPVPAPVVAARRDPQWDERRHRFTLARGPLVGALCAGVVVLGAQMSWQQVSGATAFELAARRYLFDWDAARTGREIGWILLWLCVPTALASLVRGLGWMRRLAGLVVVVICVLYVLHWQDVLNAFDAGLGSGRNVWDVVDWGVVVSFGGGVGMLASPVR